MFSSQPVRKEASRETNDVTSFLCPCRLTTAQRLRSQAESPNLDKPRANALERASHTRGRCRFSRGERVVEDLSRFYPRFTD